MSIIRCVFIMEVLNIAKFNLSADIVRKATNKMVIVLAKKRFSQGTHNIS